MYQRPKYDTLIPVSMIEELLRELSKLIDEGDDAFKEKHKDLIDQYQQITGD